MKILRGETLLTYVRNWFRNSWFLVRKLPIKIQHERKSQAIFWNQNLRTTTLNFPVPYEKYTTVESDFKQSGVFNFSILSGSTMTSSFIWNQNLLLFPFHKVKFLQLKREDILQFSKTISAYFLSSVYYCIIANYTNH